jgi:hypothetical protein
MKWGDTLVLAYIKYLAAKYIGWVLMASSVLGNILVNMHMVEG